MPLDIDQTASMRFYLIGILFFNVMEFYTVQLKHGGSWVNLKKNVGIEEADKIVKIKRTLGYVARKVKQTL